MFILLNQKSEKHLLEICFYEADNIYDIENISRFLCQVRVGIIIMSPHAVNQISVNYDQFYHRFSL